MLNRSIFKKIMAAGLVSGALLVMGMVVLPNQSVGADDPERVKQELASDLSVDMYHDAALTETRSFFDEVHFANITATQPVDQTVHNADLTYVDVLHYSDISNALFGDVHNSNITTTMPVR